MLLSQQLFDIKIINETNGDLVYYIPPQQVVALKFDYAFNEVNTLVLTTPFKQEIWDSYSLDRLIEVSTYNYSTNLLEKEATFLLRQREIYWENGIKQIAFSCVGLLDLVRRRVVKPTITDDSSAGGYVTRAGDVSDVIEEFITEQMINPDDVNRKFPNLTFSKVTGGNVVGVRVRYENLMDTLQQVRQNGDVSFEIIRDSDNDLVFRVGQLWNDYTYSGNFPSGQWVIFSPDIGNAISPYYKDDRRNERNYIFVLGEGNGVNQYILEITEPTTSDSVYNRIESTVESKSGESNQTSLAEQALTSGVKELNDSRALKEYEFDIIENREGFKYRVDWNIGDRVTFFWENVEIDFEIKGTTYTVSGEKISRSIKLELLQK